MQTGAQRWELEQLPGAGRGPGPLWVIKRVYWFQWSSHHFCLVKAHWWLALGTPPFWLLTSPSNLDPGHQESQTLRTLCCQRWTHPPKEGRYVALQLNQTPSPLPRDCWRSGTGLEPPRGLHPSTQLLKDSGDTALSPGPPEWRVYFLQNSPSNKWNDDN